MTADIDHPGRVQSTAVTMAFPVLAIAIGAWLAAASAAPSAAAHGPVIIAYRTGALLDTLYAELRGGVGRK
jgi:hypothetical protein